MEVLCDLFLPFLQSRAIWGHYTLATRLFRDSVSVYFAHRAGAPRQAFIDTELIVRGVDLIEWDAFLFGDILTCIAASRDDASCPRYRLRHDWLIAGYHDNLSTNTLCV